MAAITRKDFVEMKEKMKAMNEKLDALIAHHKGVATQGTVIPPARNQGWLGNIGHLIKRHQPRKTDVIIYHHPQFLVNAEHYKSE
jgi:hypothetical protein